ncbi:Conserved_hypothetical protein [Hexamita inflata]|uniref:Transmembrane protein n=1 Tax=Hexamita inflata TaxID=28002 RepID=A0AA86UEU8_9EUKA|nr:Conserved hypothetical protein [Hexamita inflata]
MYTRLSANCAGCYKFDNQIQLVYNPRYSENQISYSQNVNIIVYQIQSRIIDPIADVVYFDILQHRSEQDYQSEFQDNQNKVILNQFTMFIAKPEQYSRKKPKFQVNYYNLLEATICQPQQFNRELTTLLFQCGFTMMYYQIDGGKYCVMNKMLNFTEPQGCLVGETLIEVAQMQGSGVYTVTFISDNYQKYLNSEQYSNCFAFLSDLNKYIDQLRIILDLKFEYVNDDIYFKEFYNLKQQSPQIYDLVSVSQQNNLGWLINMLVILSMIIVFLQFI